VGLLVTGSFRWGGWAGRAFIWLKGARIGPKSVKHAEIDLAIFAKTLSIGRRLGVQTRARTGKEPARVVFASIPLDMANRRGIAGFVIQITVLARELLHYPVGMYGKKMMQIAYSKSIHGTTSVELILAP
jgi:hypothetical protein